MIKALQILSGTTNDITSPQSIKDAESALLSWEGSDPNRFAIYLQYVIFLSPQQCREMQTQDGFYFNLESTPRLAALLVLKSTIFRRWNHNPRTVNRKSSQYNILEEGTKNQIRRFILSLLCTGGLDGNFVIDSNLSNHLICHKLLQRTAASTLAEIEYKERNDHTIPILVRYSVSATGSNLGQSIIENTKLNVSYALETVLSMLCSKNLLADREFIHKLTQTYLPELVSSEGFTLFLNHTKSTMTPPSTFAVDYTTFILKAVHHLLIPCLIDFDDITVILEESQRNIQNQSMKNPMIETVVDQIFSMIIELLPILLAGVCSTSYPPRPSDSLQLIFESILSLLLDVVKNKCKLFLRFLSPFIAFFRNSITGTSSGKPERIIIMELLFLANTVEFQRFKPHDNNGIYIFTEDLINSFYDISLYHMTFRKDHLDYWSSDSEQFYIERSNVAADNDIISTAQHLLLAMAESEIGGLLIASKIPTILADFDDQILTAKVEAGLQIMSDGNNKILFWDTIYTVVGISIRIMKKKCSFDFNGWFDSCLINECLRIIQEKSSTARNILPILRYRILWLLGCIHDEIDMSPLGFDLLLSSIGNSSHPHNDMMVKLAVIQTLTSLAQEFDQCFLSCLKSPHHILCSLCQVATSCIHQESRNQSFECIYSIFVFMLGCRMEQDILSRAGSTVVEYLLEIDQDTLMSREVFSIITCISQVSNKEHSVRLLHRLALPLIHRTLDPSNRQDNLCLVEEALQLWYTLIRNNPVSLESTLDSIFEKVIDLLEHDYDHVRILMKIIEAYIIVGRASFNKHAPIFQYALNKVTGQVNPRGSQYVHLVFEALLRKYPSDGTTLLHNGGITQSMLQSCASNNNVNTTHDSYEPDDVIVLYLTSLARMLVQSSSSLDTKLPISVSGQFNFGELLDLYFKLFQCAGEGKTGVFRQKLWVLCFLSLMPTSDSFTTNRFQKAIVQRLNQVLQSCLNVLSNESSNYSYLVMDYDSDCDYLHHDNVISSYSNLCQAAAEKVSV